MASRRNALLAAAKTQLEAAGKPAGFKARRTPTRLIPQGELPIGAVYPIEEEVARVTQQPSRADRGLNWGVLVRAVGAPGTPPDEAIDPHVSWTVQAVMADPTLGGVARQTREMGTQWVYDEHDRTLIGAEVRFRSEYVTRADDPDHAP